jgi:flagellar motor switch protein FliN/FliY
MGTQANKQVEAYLEAWSGSLAALLSQLSGNDWQTQPASAIGDYVPIARAAVTAQQGLLGQQWLSISAADAETLLHPFLQEETTIATELDAKQWDALAELLRQWSALAASALQPTFGEVVLEVLLQAALEPVAQNSPLTSRLLQVSEGPHTLAVLLEMDDAIIAALQCGTFIPAPPSAPVNPSAEIQSLLRQGNLGLLMDVELGVMLRFGCRQATLREVLELTSGTVLELDREIQEPVDLVLNGRVIARGDVVVIDGNYGLRVTEVASPQQRVGSL